MKKVLVFSLFVLCVPFIFHFQVNAQSVSGQALQYHLDMGAWKYQPLESVKIYVDEDTEISTNKDGRFKVRLPKSMESKTNLHAHYGDYLHVNWKNQLAIKPDSNQLLNLIFMDPEDLYVLKTSFRSLAKHMVSKAFEEKVALLGGRFEASSNPIDDYMGDLNPHKSSTTKNKQ